MVSRMIGRMGVLWSGLALGAATLFVASPAATAAPVAPAVAWNCPDGSFCIFSGWNGEGTPCQWTPPSKANTADDCSFIQNGQTVLSVWNRTNQRKQYYTHTNFNNRVGSTPSGGRGNLQGSYQIRSFRPQ